MIRLNQEQFRDKVYGCWMGKSIGGTLGTPFEGRRELLDVQDFHSPAGKPLPNDDLDLQLVWLKALEDYGPLGVNEQVLGEYWLSYIPPHWNEYGLGKSNMKAGILPPLSGDVANVWRHSNGAWIRSEIWACCTPASPEIAARYAWADACVDHGTGEGTYAELFTATVESAAFTLQDRLALIQIGLSHIPAGCRVARSIQIVLDSYAKGLGWKETRQLVLEDSADLGWFQAPANLAYVIIGWLYGEGDFKKSLLIAVSCGDDTDCTGATLGSILGIIQGAAALPADWKRHVGDDIITVAIDRGSLYGIPLTCTALTERTMAMCRQVLAAFKADVAIGDGETDLDGLTPERLMASERYALWLKNMSHALVFNFIHTRAELTYPESLSLEAGQCMTLEITLHNQLREPRHLDISCLLPDGLTLAEGPKHVNLPHKNSLNPGSCSFRLTLQAGAEIQAVNRGVIQMVAQGRPTVILLPVLVFGA
ncbi:MAG: ADP-ribosylglycohydrolase family protein [Clostridiaceae bacterium]|nr:ADP-ribosylglycohydrolase family protein [Clostridiaceae bacterium]